MVFEWVDGWLVTCVWLSHLNADNWLPDCDPRPDEKGQLLDKVSLRPSSSSSSFEFANESFFKLKHHLSDHCCPNWCLEPFWTKTWVKGPVSLKATVPSFSFGQWHLFLRLASTPFPSFCIRRTLQIKAFETAPAKGIVAIQILKAFFDESQNAYFLSFCKFSNRSHLDGWTR